MLDSSNNSGTSLAGATGHVCKKQDFSAVSHCYHSYCDVQKIFTTYKLLQAVLQSQIRPCAAALGSTKQQNMLLCY